MTAVDDPGLEAHRKTLRLHCYRMTGSFHDADDLTQEVLVRAWQKLPSFRGESSVATWLYRIATNVCLDFLRGRKNRVLPWGPEFPRYETGRELPPPLLEALWLEPFPTPEDAAVRREHLSLAFVTLLQTLPAGQRAAVLLCDVLDYSARDAADLLGATVAGINSALQRARRTLRTNVCLDEVDLQGRREVVERFLAAWETGDTKAMIELMNENTRMTMPPIPLWVRGQADIRRVLDDYPFRQRDPHRWKLVEAPGANGESALGFYDFDGTVYRPWGIQVLVMARSDRLPTVSEYHVFKAPHLVRAFGLPESLPDQNSLRIPTF